MSKAKLSALATAAKYLQTSERTEAELRKHLVARDFPPTEIEAAVAWAVQKRYVSDSRLAEREVETAKGPRAIGRDKARAKLEKRGASEESVEQAMAHYSEAEELQVALRLAQSKFTSENKPEKIARFLLGRGFGEEAVRATIATFRPDLEW